MMKEVLGAIHSDWNWYENEEDIPKMNPETFGDYCELEIMYREDLGKWSYGHKFFKRQGQARKAAWQVFKEMKKNAT